MKFVVERLAVGTPDNVPFDELKVSPVGRLGEMLQVALELKFTIGTSYTLVTLRSSTKVVVS